jgi:tRNA A58 N-methylase Trm61
MADNLDNFSIQGTMEMGMGNQELLNDLFSPETSTSNPEDVTPIIKDADAPEAPAAPAVKKGKDIVPPKSVDGKTDDEKLEGQSMIADFLSDDDDDTEDDNDTPAPAAKAKAPADALADDDDDDDDDDTPQGTQFTALANDLYKLGVFTSDDEEPETVNTAEEFLERFNEEKKKGASEIVQNFIGQFGEDYQEAFDAIFVKGVNPKDYFGVYNQVVNFAEMDLSNEDNQTKVIRQALTDQGFDPEDVDTEVERLKNYGDLESVAAKHHKVLVKKEAAKLNQLEQKSEAELQQKAQIRNQYIKNVQDILNDKVKSKEFDGIPINPKLATELQDFLLVDKWKTPTGETLTDFDRAILDMKKPENHAMKVKLGLLMKMLEKDPTLSTIQRTGVTKKSNELFGEVARQVTKAKSTGSSSVGGANSKSWFL